MLNQLSTEWIAKRDVDFTAIICHDWDVPVVVGFVWNGMFLHCGRTSHIPKRSLGDIRHYEGGGKYSTKMLSYNIAQQLGYDISMSLMP